MSLNKSRLRIKFGLSSEYKALFSVAIKPVYSSLNAPEIWTWDGLASESGLIQTWLQHCNSFLFSFSFFFCNLVQGCFYFSAHQFTVIIQPSTALIVFAKTIFNCIPPYNFAEWTKHLTVSMRKAWGIWRLNSWHGIVAQRCSFSLTLCQRSVWFLRIKEK